MRLPIQSAGNRSSTSTKTQFTGVFPTQLSNPQLASNFEFETAGLPISDCCIFCRPGCRCCYAFSGFVINA